MVHYNLDKLIAIEITDLAKSERYVYKEEKRLFGFLLRKAGVYKTHNFLADFINVQNQYVLKDKVIYVKPKIILTYQDNISKIYLFDTYKEAENFRNEILKNGEYIM